MLGPCHYSGLGPHRHSHVLVLRLFGSWWLWLPSHCHCPFSLLHALLTHHCVMSCHCCHMLWVVLGHCCHSWGGSGEGSVFMGHCCCLWVLVSVVGCCHPWWWSWAVVGVGGVLWWVLTTGHVPVLLLVFKGSVHRNAKNHRTKLNQTMVQFIFWLQLPEFGAIPVAGC